MYFKNSRHFFHTETPSDIVLFSKVFTSLVWTAQCIYSTVSKIPVELILTDSNVRRIKKLRLFESCLLSGREGY